MRYLKRQTLNRRVANDPSLYVDKNGQVVMGNNSDLLLPTGTTGQQPSGTTPGRIRYNTTKGNVEVYQGTSWRALRYQEATTIFQQNLGAGDDSITLFGPLNSTYYNPSNVSSSNSTFGGQNIIVIVENVIQVSTINYTVVQNPTITPLSNYTAYPTTTTSNVSTLYFNTSLNVTNAGWYANQATLTLSNTTSTGACFAIGSTIVVTGIVSTGQTPSAFNGTFTVTNSTATTVAYTLTTNPGTYLGSGGGQAGNGGNVTASGSYKALFPSVNLTGLTVSGTNIYSGSTITTYTTDPNTDALTSITLNHATTGSVNINSTITIQTNSQTISDNSWYLQFSTPVPYGKVVIALLGFDQ
jgi:hypothetical protein